MLKLAVRLQQVKFHAQDRGATAVEYGLIVAAIAAVIVVVVGTLGGKVHDAFQFVNDNMK